MSLSTQVRSIRELDGSVGETSTVGKSEWTFNFSWADQSSSFRYPDHNGQLERFRWYLETHASADPLDTRKAAQIRAEVTRYADLLRQSLPESLHEQQPFMLDVHGADAPGSSPQESSFHSIAWELLESPPPPHLPSIVVRRRVTPKTEQTAPTSAPDTFNILVVAARREGDDEDYRQAALPLLRLIQELPDGAPVVSLEIVRPGRYRALEEHLTHAAKRGHTFHLVHLDLHGGLHPKHGARLFFSDKAKSAADVSKLLNKHKVQYAVLNACESARGDSGLKANLAQNFVREGMVAVLAMSYKLNVSAVTMLTHHFYDALFRQNMSWTRAAAATRAHMRETASRNGRFGIRVELQDWIVPVSYGSTEVDPVMTSLQRVSRVQRRWAILPGGSSTSGKLPVDLMGRDADILKMEDMLLSNARANRGRMLFLDGNMGVGKTSLLKHLQWWWTSTGMVTQPVYVDFNKHWSQSPEEVCKFIVHELDPQKEKQPATNGGPIELLLEIISAPFKTPYEDSEHSYPRPLLLFDNLWRSEFPKGKNGLPESYWNAWKAFFKRLVRSSAFTIVSSHRYPWYLDDHPSSEFDGKTLYVLPQLRLNRMDLTREIGESMDLEKLLRDPKDVAHLDLILDWCGADAGLLKVFLPAVRKVGVEKAAAMLTNGDDIMSRSEISLRDLKRLPAFKACKDLWKKAPGVLNKELIAFAPFHKFIPRCHETYLKEYNINKHPITHSLLFRLAKYNPAAVQLQSRKILSARLMVIGQVVSLMIPILKTMGLIRAEHMMGATSMQSGFNGSFSHQQTEGTKIHSIHPVFSLFLRHQARKAGFIPSNKDKPSPKSLCLEKTFVGYHEARAFEWITQLQSGTGPWDSAVEMQMCKSSFVTAMDINLRAPWDHFDHLNPTPAFLFWCMSTNDREALSYQPMSKELLATSCGRALIRGQEQLRSFSYRSHTYSLTQYVQSTGECIQLSLWLAVYSLLQSGDRKAFAAHVSTADTIMDGYLRRDIKDFNGTLFPNLDMVKSGIASFKRIRDEPDCDELTILAELPSPLPAAEESPATRGWAIIRESLSIMQRLSEVHSHLGSLGFWDADGQNAVLNVIYDEADEFLTQLAPAWLDFLYHLDADTLCHFRCDGFREEDDQIMNPDTVYDQIARDLISHSRYRPPPNYASSFMAAVRNRKPPLAEVRTSFDTAWQTWSRANARGLSLDLLDVYLALETDLHRALAERAQIGFLSTLNDWSLIDEHLDALVAPERRLPLADLRDPQLERVVWWHFMKAAAALHTADWALCLHHTVVILDIAASTDTGPRLAPAQHLQALMLLVLLHTEVPASLALPYPLSLPEALIKALLLGYASIHHPTSKPIYARNGALLALLLRPPPAPLDPLVLAALSYLLGAHGALATGSDENGNPCADRNLAAILAHRTRFPAFPLAEAFVRRVLRAARAALPRGVDAQREVLAHAETHLFAHARGCGCEFAASAAVPEAELEGPDSAALPVFDLRAAFAPFYAPRLMGVVGLVQLWLGNKFRGGSGSGGGKGTGGGVEGATVDERTEERLRYLARWHAAAS